MIQSRPKRREFILLFGILIFCLPASLYSQDAGQYPMAEITNSSVTIHLMLPDPVKGYYRGTRFDWSGLIQRIEYNGHTFFGDWKTTHNPTNNDDANGTASEFGMYSPLGYNDAAVGDSFVKIGIGKIRKPNNKAYQFYYNYTIAEALPWEIESGKNWIEFRQELKDFKGWAYRYSKRIELDLNQPVFTVSHSLQNTGSKAIETDFYCHNFVKIDDQFTGPDYRLTFAFPLKTQNSLRGIAQVVGTEIVFLKSLTSGSLYAEFTGYEAKPEHNQAKVFNAKTQAGIQIQGNRPPTLVHFYAEKLAVCPEFFVAVSIPTGETLTWENKYTLIVNAAIKYSMEK